LATRI